MPDGWLPSSSNILPSTAVLKLKKYYSYNLAKNLLPCMYAILGACIARTSNLTLKFVILWFPSYVALASNREIQLFTQHTRKRPPGHQRARQNMRKSQTNTCKSLKKSQRHASNETKGRVSQLACQRNLQQFEIPLALIWRKNNDCLHGTEQQRVPQNSESWLDTSMPWEPWNCAAEE